MDKSLLYTLGAAYFLAPKRTEPTRAEIVLEKIESPFLSIFAPVKTVETPEPLQPDEPALPLEPVNYETIQENERLIPTPDVLVDHGNGRDLPDTEGLTPGAGTFDVWGAIKDIGIGFLSALSPEAALGVKAVDIVTDHYRKAPEFDPELVGLEYGEFGDDPSGGDIGVAPSTETGGYEGYGTFESYDSGNGNGNGGNGVNGGNGGSVGAEGGGQGQY